MDSLPVFFSSWGSLGRIVAIGVPLYLFLVGVLRWGGKHSLAKTNAYGLVVTVSMGSALASAVLTREVSLADGALAIVLLLALQYLLAMAASRSRRVGRLLTGKPSLLLRDGRLLEDNLRRERVSREEVLAAVRKQGLGSLEQVAAVVLETDGSFSVVVDRGLSGSALEDVSD